MTITELKAQLEQRKADKKAEIATLKEEISLRHEIAKLDSPLYAKRELAIADNTTLDVILTQAETVYARNNRKMSKVFGYGLIPNKILTLLKAIQFSKAEDRDELLLITGLDEQIIEDTLDAFGQTAYFSKASITIMPAIPMDTPRIKELLKLVATDMRLVSELDLGKFTIENIRYQYDRAQINADEMLTNTQELVDIATTVTYEE